MGTCQSMQSELTQEIALTQTSSKRIKKQNEQIMSFEINKFESELQADEELFPLSIYTSVKKDKVTYNFQEEELSTIKTSPPQLPIQQNESGKQKRKRYRASLTQQDRKITIQEPDLLGLSLQLGNDQESNSKSYRSILKKNSNMKSLSGSPSDNNRRSVRFAGGTNFRSKSQRSIRRSSKYFNQPNLKQQSQKSSKFAKEGRSPLKKQQRSQDGINERYKQDIQLFGKPRINYILF